MKCLNRNSTRGIVYRLSFKDIDNRLAAVLRTQCHCLPCVVSTDPLVRQFHQPSTRMCTHVLFSVNPAVPILV